MCRYLELDLFNGCETVIPKDPPAEETAQATPVRGTAFQNTSLETIFYRKVMDKYQGCRCKGVRIRILFGECPEDAVCKRPHDILRNLTWKVNEAHDKNVEVKPKLVSALEAYVGRMNYLPRVYRRAVDKVGDESTALVIRDMLVLSRIGASRR